MKLQTKDLALVVSDKKILNTLLISPFCCQGNHSSAENKILWACFERASPMDHSCYVWSKPIKWFMQCCFKIVDRQMMTTDGE